MDSLSPQVVFAAKLPILNPNEFDLWKMSIKQYFLMNDYSLREVILNGDSPVPTRIVEGVLQPVAPTTAEQRLARKNDLKARGTLLMALPDKHQLKFNSHKDSKTLMEAIEKRFGAASQNLAFVSSTYTDSIADSVSAAASVSTACVKLPASPLPNVNSLKMDLRWQMAMLTMRDRRFLQKTGRNLGANGPTSMGFDMSKVECYNCHMKRHFAKECRSPMDLRRPGAAEPQRRTVPVKTSTSNALVSQCDGLESVEARCLVYKQNESVFEENIKLLNIKVQLRDTTLVTLRHKLEKAEQERDALKLKLEKFQTSSKNLTDLLASQANEKAGLGYNSQVPTKCPTKPEQDLSHTTRPSAPIIEDWVFDSEEESKTKAPQFVPSFAYSSEHMKTPRHSVQVPTAVLTPSKPVSNTIVRPVSAALPNLIVTRPRHAHQVVTKFKSPIKRHITRSPSSRTSNSPPRVSVVQVPVVSVVQGKQGTWGNPQQALKDKRVNDSACSRHMTGNMSYLSDFEELNGGYVAFGGNPKGGKITGKGKIKKDKLDFDDVYFVKELKFNLFSLPDESQVLLSVPRENNMYNVNLKNIVPSGDLTCLFAKATLDESNLWRRRLAHINFKTINKLVKGNLVRGLPIKVFENDHTCVACKKGKQHRASFKTKPVNSVDQPLFRLHMDLFKPTFVKSLNKKSYCLVITDDYSRFTWVFFMATKDETTPILKTFITILENPLSLKAKVIRSDNETEFKNYDLNQLCGLKGIKREFNVPMTPQQNGIAKRKNWTLIENRVLVTKPHNKTPYELLHGRTPSIGFMRPFGCPVTILNTLDPLGKFQRKVDEGFIVGYSVCSKAFRVFNSKTRIIQETLHVNFLENKPNVAGTGPKWLFDINSLTRTMNYQPVHNNAEDAAFDGKEHDFDVKKPESVVILSSSSSAQSKEQDDKTKKEAKRKIPTVGQNSLNNTNTFSAAGPSNDAVSPTYGKTSDIDAS
nr:hypothetical protein [Tanacetum cinerariifolium]